MIAAVVDWEMSTLGDPLADLGLTLSYWADGGEAFPDLNVGATVTALPGFYTREQFAARYAELTGRDVSEIGYYIAFGYFKLAVVLEGIHARYLLRQTVGEGFEREGPAVPVPDRPPWLTAAETDGLETTGPATPELGSRRGQAGWATRRPGSNGLE